MSIADAPTSFGYPVFLRIFLPGFVTSCLTMYIGIPAAYYYNINLNIFIKLISLTLTERLIILAIFGFLLGMLIYLLDFYIYQFLEGIRFWYQPIWVSVRERALNSYNDLIKDIDKKKSLKITTEDRKSKLVLENQIRNLSGKIRAFPVNKSDIEATNLGNILKEYETYPEEQYGMKLNIFWSRLLLILPEETKKELDLRGAEADLTVYLTFIFLIFSPIAGIRSFQLWGIIPALFVFFILLAITKIIFYELSLRSHLSYGKYVKAVFYIYRIDLSNKLNLPIHLCPDKQERAIWKEYGQFLDEYVMPENVLKKKIK